MPLQQQRCRPRPVAERVPCCTPPPPTSAHHNPVLTPTPQHSPKERVVEPRALRSNWLALFAFACGFRVWRACSHSCAGSCWRAHAGPHRVYVRISAWASLSLQPSVRVGVRCVRVHPGAGPSARPRVRPGETGCLRQDRPNRCACASAHPNCAKLSPVACGCVSGRLRVPTASACFAGAARASVAPVSPGLRRPVSPGLRRPVSLSLEHSVSPGLTQPQAPGLTRSRCIPVRPSPVSPMRASPPACACVARMFSSPV